MEGELMMTDGSYDIFKKHPDNTTVRVESVKGIEEAQKRVDELNGTGPEQYFVFDPIQAVLIEPSEPSVVKDPFKL
jgi:hypothetical protein